MIGASESEVNEARDKIRTIVMDLLDLLRNGDARGTRAVLGKPRDVNTKDSTGSTSLIYSAKLGLMEVFAERPCPEQWGF